jgi:hypothetical protein
MLHIYHQSSKKSKLRQKSDWIWSQCPSSGSKKAGGNCIFVGPWTGEKFDADTSGLYCTMLFGAAQGMLDKKVVLTNRPLTIYIYTKCTNGIVEITSSAGSRTRYFGRVWSRIILLEQNPLNLKRFAHIVLCSFWDHLKFQVSLSVGLRKSSWLSFRMWFPKIPLPLPQACSKFVWWSGEISVIDDPGLRRVFPVSGKVDPKSSTSQMCHICPMAVFVDNLTAFTICSCCHHMYGRWYLQHLFVVGVHTFKLPPMILLAMISMVDRSNFFTSLRICSHGLAPKKSRTITIPPDGEVIIRWYW